VRTWMRGFVEAQENGDENFLVYVRADVIGVGGIDQRESCPNPNVRKSAEYYK